MLSLTYVENSPGLTGAPGDLLRAADNTALQEFPRDQQSYAAPTAALTQAVSDWLAQRGPRPEPVVVLVHGFMYDPSQPRDNPDSPFDSVYGSPADVDHHSSWLPLVGECDEDGANQADNAVAFSYKSTGGLAEVGAAGWNNPYQLAVFDLAPRAARALASVLGALVAQAPRVRILAHSLGTRTTSQAILLVRARLSNALDRVVMLDGAEFCVDAAASFTGCQFDVFNIVNGTDTVLRWGGEQACAPIRAANTIGSCVIGYNGLGANDRWLDLQLDNDKLVAWLAAGNAPDGIRYAIDATARESSHPLAGLDHWACYTNDGNRPLVRDLIGSDLMTIPRMKSFGVPGGTNATSYGIFNDQTIPKTPVAVTERQRVLALGGLAPVASVG